MPPAWPSAAGQGGPAAGAHLLRAQEVAARQGAHDHPVWWVLGHLPVETFDVFSFGNCHKMLHGDVLALMHVLLPLPPSQPSLGTPAAGCCYNYARDAQGRDPGTPRLASWAPDLVGSPLSGSLVAARDVEVPIGFPCLRPTACGTCLLDVFFLGTDVQASLSGTLARSGRMHAQLDGNPPPHLMRAGIIPEEVVEPMPPLLRALCRRLTRWGILPAAREPNSAIINIYEAVRDVFVKFHRTASRVAT